MQEAEAKQPKERIYWRKIKSDSWGTGWEGWSTNSRYCLLKEQKIRIKNNQNTDKFNTLFSDINF